MDTNSQYVFSQAVAALQQSGIRAASTRCAELGGINLGQGMCDIPVQAAIKQAAAQAIAEDKNLYAPYEGVPNLRAALAHKIQQFNHVSVDPEREILVSHGATGAYVSAAKALFNPGDEVILFEPFYGYHRYVLELLGVSVAAAEISSEDYAIDINAVAKLIRPHTKAIVICTPCNPCGKVFTREELIQIGELAKQHNLYIITDEIYEYITYPGHAHCSIASLPAYQDRTITISGFSKTYNVTGWRLGYAYGPAEIIHKMALVHDLLYICPPTPLQHAMLAALSLGPTYYAQMQQTFLHKRDYMFTALQNLGFKTLKPQGAYYFMADCSALDNDGQKLAIKLLEEAKVAVVPGNAFYFHPDKGRAVIRICYALDESRLQQAIQQLQKIL